MRLGGLALFAAATVATGCTGTVTASSVSVSTDAEPATTSAIVIVERTIDATTGDASQQVRAAASARFVRVAGAASMLDALHAIGAAGDLPVRGACATLTSLTGGVAPDEPAPVVELVDMGTVSLEAGGAETHLVPRQLPDVTDVVSGVVYARATDPAFLPAAARYGVRVGGRAGLAAFEVSALAPADPGDIRVAGEAADGRVNVASSSVELTWPPDGTADLVYVDVQPAGVRCVLGDGIGDGEDRIHATVPASLLDDAGLLVVHRLHREPLKAPGLESGEIRFDFARSLAYDRASPHR